MRAAPERTLVFLPVAQYSGFFSVPRVPLHSREPVRRLLFRFPLPPLHAREPVCRLLCRFPLPSTRESLFAGSYSGRGPNLLYFIIFSMNGEKYWTVYEYILSFLFLLTYYLQSITKDTNAAYLLTSINFNQDLVREVLLAWQEPWLTLLYSLSWLRRALL